MSTQPPQTADERYANRSKSYTGDEIEFQTIEVLIDRRGDFDDVVMGVADASRTSGLQALQ